MTESLPSLCPVRTDLFVAVSSFSPFRTTVAMERIHSLSRFRFGHSSDILLLLDNESTRSEQNDYLVGLMWSSFALLMLFLLWLLLLLSLRWLGPDRVGLFSAVRSKLKRPEALPRTTLEKKKACIETEKHQHRGSTVPFQSNGVVSSGVCCNEEAVSITSSSAGATAATSLGRSSITTAPTKAAKKIVRETIKAPKRIISKARKSKRKLEEKFDRTKKFDRLRSNGDVSAGGPDDLDFGDEEQGDVNGDFDDDENDNNSDGDADVAVDRQSPGSEERRTQDGSSDLLWTQQDERQIADYEEQLKVYYRTCDVRNARMRRVRVAVAICALGVIISAVLFVVMGMDSLTQSVGRSKEGIDQLTSIAQETIVVVQDVTEKEEVASQSTQKFLESLNEMCPNRTTSFCTNVDSPEERQCDFSSVPPLEDELTKLVGFFDGTMDMVFKGMDDVEADLNRFIQIMDKADTYYPESFNWAFWVAAGCNLALATICLGLCLAVMLLYFGKPLADKFKWLRSYLMVPLFVLLVALGWIYSTSFVVLSVGATDACINSPDLTVATILDNLRGSFQSNILYEFLVYYVRGCPPDLVPDELNQRLVILSQLVAPALQDLAAAIARADETAAADDGATAALSHLCGADWTPLSKAASALGEQLCDLAQAMADVRLLLKCENWYPPYRATVHDAVCQDGTAGLGWAVSTQLAIVLLSMIILTLRLAYYELDEVSGGNGSGCCGCFGGGANGKQDDTENEEESR